MLLRVLGVRWHGLVWGVSGGSRTFTGVIKSSGGCRWRGGWLLAFRVGISERCLDISALEWSWSERRIKSILL